VIGGLGEYECLNEEEKQFFRKKRRAVPGLGGGKVHNRKQLRRKKNLLTQIGRRGRT